VIIDQCGVWFFNYSLGFLFEGSEGLKNEGAVGIILGFLKVFPTTFPEVLIGCGFYGGSEFSPWTDPAYSRMFLSVGYFWFYFLCLLFLVVQKCFFHIGCFCL
jgi:hypothetical protein